MLSIRLLRSVWTGQDAMQKGLVDEIGDFDDAIEAAASSFELKATISTG